jgi:VWFA-related protein
MRSAPSLKLRNTCFGAALMLLAASAAARGADKVAAPGAAPPATPAVGGPEATFQDVSQVVSVQVPVEVVGRDGLPVRGLTADDFEIFDEGQKQPLRSFRTVDLDRLEPTGTTAAGLSTEARQLDASARRHFLLLFDLSFSRPAAVLRAREAARDFVLHSLRPTDLAAVATYSLQTGPRLVLTFTGDRAQLARAILSLGLDNVVEQEKVDPLRFVIAAPTVAELATASGSGEPVGTTRSLADQVMAENLASLRSAVQRADRTYQRNMIHSYMQSMAGLAKILDAVRGRKHVVLFSEGFDSNLLVGHDTVSEETTTENFNIAFGSPWLVDNDNRFGNSQLQGELRKMLSEFKRADCVIESVDISGLVAGTDASEPVRAGRTSGQEELFETANETGGELLTSTNDFRSQLDRVLARSTVTYLLSFERSDLAPDGAFHNLRVSVKAPAGARIAYRTGYYAPRPYPELDPLAKVLLASDGLASAAPRTDLDLDVLVTPFRLRAKVAYVPVIVEIGGSRLMAGRKSDKLLLELYAYVSDNRGQMQDFFTQKVAVDLKKANTDVLTAGLKYYGHVELPPGQYLVRVLVRDAESGRTGVETVPLAIPSWDTAASQLLPPFFVDSRAGWLMLRERGADPAKSSGGVLYPFTYDGEPYVPAALPAVTDGAKARVCLVGYNLGTGDLSLQAKVMAADGLPLDGGELKLLTRTATEASGLDKLVAVFQPTGRRARRYIHQVAVTDPKTGRREISSGPFQVVP